MKEKCFTAEFTKEAEEQLSQIDIRYRRKIIEAIIIFEQIGTDYKNINDLGNGLFEIKPKGVRAYFMYDPNRRQIIIIGFICLKKTQKAPLKYMKQARKNIENRLKELKNDKI